LLQLPSEAVTRNSHFRGSHGSCLIVSGGRSQLHRVRDLVHRVENLQRCCMADRPIDCWGSETSETRSSFDELTDTCYSTEPCPKQAVVEDSRYCVFMQRVSNSVLFNRTWAEYESGFGNSENWW
uniref:Fibrinogen C-terminal domain-containing protein n=1 Tax=Macrostomum lignano TaxID=282301 RepID=A0A1I8IWP3_9PLAT